MKKILIFLIAAIVLSINAYSQEDLTHTNLREMLAALNGKVPLTLFGVDSVVVYDGHVYFWIGGDTLGIGILFADMVPIEDEVIMLTDTLRSSGKHILYTQWQVDSIMAAYTPSGGGGSSNSVFVQLSDTIPLFIFGAGGGNPADTSYFKTSTIYGAFFNKGSDSLKITELRAIMVTGGGTDTLDLDISWDATFNNPAPTQLNTTQLPIGLPNGLTTGTVDVSFDEDVIPPDVWVWAETPYVPATANKPRMLTVTLSGYKIPSYIDRFSNVRMLSDTIPLATFGAGGGNAVDTASFTTSTKYGAFFNKGSDTLNITELRAVMGHGVGTDTLDIQVQWHATLGSGSATKLNTNALPILSITTGTTDTSFANAKIPPNVWVWATTPYVPADALKRKPTFLLIQISGYKTPKY